MGHKDGVQSSDTDLQSPLACPPSAPATPCREAGPPAPERLPLPDLVLHHIASLLPPNEVACNLRLASHSFAVVLCGPQHAIVRMSQPVPEHALQARWGHPDVTRSLTLRQRQELLCRVAVAGVVSNLKALVGCVGCALTAAVLAAAAGGGQLDMCKWLREDCQCPWDMTVVIAAVRAGSQHVCAWLHASGCPWAATWREWALDTAAEAGHRQLCEWLLTQGCEWCPTAPAAAARHGHVALMHWLCGLHRRDPSRGVHVGELVRGLAYGCGLAELQQGYAEWLDVRGRQLGEWCREGVVAAAAASTTADWRNKVEWLLGNKGYPVAQQACDRAAQCTDAPERLVWLLRRGFRLGRSVVALAASNADGGALAWVVGRLQQQHKQSQLQGVGRSPACSSPQNRQRLPQGVQEAANSRDPDGACACTQSAAVAEQKQIRCEPALSLHGLDAAVTGAAESGHLCALQVLHDHGAHISQEALCAAARAGQLQVVAWVVEALGAQPAAPEEQGREQHQLQQRMLEQQLQLLQRQQEQLLLPHTDVDPGQLVFMPAARQRPQLTAALFRGAAESGRLDLMAWLHARGCPWDQGVFAAAVGTGCTEQIEWLARTGCPIKADGSPYTVATANGDLATLRTLSRLGCPHGTGPLPSHALRQCGVAVLRELRLLGCPVDWVVHKDS